jgi:hypothetical protein
VILLSLNGYPLRRVNVANGNGCSAASTPDGVESSLTRIFFSRMANTMSTFTIWRSAPGIYLLRSTARFANAFLRSHQTTICSADAGKQWTVHFSFARSGVLKRNASMPNTGVLSGSAISIAEPVTSRDGWGPTAQFSASNTGVLATKRRHWNNWYG